MTVGVLWLFLTVPGNSLQCVIVIFPDHSHLLFSDLIIKVSNGAKIRNRYNQVPYLTYDTNITPIVGF